MPPSDPNYQKKLTRFGIGAVLMVMVAMSLYYVVHRGYYPAAFVGSHMITEATLDEAVEVVVHYYAQALKTYAATDTTLEEKQVSVPDVRRLTLDKMIENEFISRELAKTVGEELSELVAAKINSAQLSDPEFEKAVETLYGISTRRFKDFILEPQAREEVLQNTRFQTGEEDYKKWLTETRMKATVVVLASDLAWDGKEVILRK